MTVPKRTWTFFQDADAIILDAQYTLGEAFEKYDWGHSSYSMAVDFAIEFGIKDLYLFHHEPLYDDKKMSSISAFRPVVYAAGKRSS